MAISKKVIKVKEKYEKKIKIIQENCELTDEEKFTLYSNLQDKIEKLKKKNTKNYDKKLLASEISRVSSGGDDGVNKVLVGGTAGLLSILGIVGIAAASAPAVIALAGAGLGVGLLALVNSIFNIGYESLNEKLITKAMYDKIDLNEVYEELNKQLETMKSELNIEEAQVQDGI